MAVVYSLETDGLVWYVGSTTCPTRRERDHLHKRDKGIGASLIPLDYEWKFKVLEECDREVMRERERHWYERLLPLYNKNVPNRSHKEARREADRKWREANRDTKREALRKWREANYDAYLESNREANRRYWAKKKSIQSLTPS